MSMFAVNGVRIDPLSARVTHVRWAAVNPADRSWAATPSEAPVADVARALASGNDVRAIFGIGRHRDRPPAEARAVSRCIGRHRADIDATNESRTLRDLPQI